MRARIIKKSITSILALLIFSVSVAFHVGAEEYRGIDVFIVMDNSGSMRTNDSGNLRYEGLKSFIHKLSLGDSIGVIHFNTKVEVQIPITEIKSYEEKAFLVEEIDYIPPSKDTDVYAGLSKAFEEMNNRSSSRNTKFFVLVTDGVIDPGSKYRTNKELRDKYYQDLDQLINKYEDKLWPIFVVFLNSSEIEDDYLKGIAQRTGGSYYNPHKASQFEKIFNQILNRICAIKAQVAKEIETKTSAEEDLDIQVKVISPSNEKHYLSETTNIEAQLLLNSGRLIEDRFTSIDSYQVKVIDPDRNVFTQELSDQGNKGDAKKGDGIYSSFFIPDKKGRYEITFIAKGKFKGKPFNANRIYEMEVLPPSVININTEDYGTREVMQGKNLKIPLEFSSDIESKQIIEFVLDPQSNIEIDPIKISVFPDNNKRTVLKIPIPRNFPVGDHRIQLFISGFGRGIEIEPNKLEANIRVLPYDFLVSNQLLIHIILVVAIMAILVSGSLFFVKLIHKARKSVKGRIVFYKDDKKIEVINLTKIKKQRVKVATRMDYKPDILIDAKKPFMFQIYTRRDILGTRSWFGRDSKPSYFLYVDMEDAPIELTHNSRFTIDNYKFIYHNKKATAEIGRNVLWKYELTIKDNKKV